jgi:hypothetical protein
LTCGNGTRSRHYSVTTQAANQGLPCFSNGTVVSDRESQIEACNPQACPGLSQAGQTIYGSVTLNVDISDLPKDWQTQFKTDLAGLLNISDERIEIIKFVAGSVVVDFSVKPAADGTNIQENDLNTAFSVSGVKTLAGFTAKLTYAGLIQSNSTGTLTPTPTQTPAAVAASASSSVGIVVAALVAVVVIAVLGTIGYKRLGRGAARTAATPAVRPAMMSPSATAYMTETDPEDQSTTSATTKRARKLSF